tara:strand:+ start:2775 stop:2888 length:114 start_codon:yes stop_codon:yes gene_type:complete
MMLACGSSERFYRLDELENKNQELTDVQMQVVEAEER